MSVPTQAEIDATLKTMEADGDFYHELGEHNREVARERIAAFRANVDDITQTRITGYHARWPQDLDTQDRLVRMLESNDPRPSIVKPILIGILILLGAFAVAWIFS